MNTIVPAILPSSYEDITEKLLLLKEEAKAVQIDIVDGIFIGPASWPYQDVSAEDVQEMSLQIPSLPASDQIEYEMDLMVSNPGSTIAAWIAAGARSITIHAESTDTLPDLMNWIHDTYGMGYGAFSGKEQPHIGIALNLDTDINLIEPLLSQIQYVQFMGIATIGRQGEPFDNRVLDRVRTFAAAHPKVRIHVDGGVSLETAPALIEAGVDRLIVGSALWKSHDVLATLKKLSALTKNDVVS